MYMKISFQEPILLQTTCVNDKLTMRNVSVKFYQTYDLSCTTRKMSWDYFETCFKILPQSEAKAKLNDESCARFFA